ncbi:unnamed protein product [Prorocentrum cordatum]|uniref:EF-hand domain-containing protein n=1 Tax=Prorocentrum cordatum TaxID=2364126 RepID=A0ABN9VU28_9DINO|nr:unnamed protein product [Polarella glacialis]
MRAASEGQFDLPCLHVPCWPGEEYLEKQRIMELFNDLCASVAFNKPQDVRAFLLQELAKREREGAQAGLFEDSEIVAVFQLADLKSHGVISSKQARAALLSLASSERQRLNIETMELPDELDLPAFQEKAKSVLRGGQGGQLHAQAPRAVDLALLRATAPTGA